MIYKIFVFFLMPMAILAMFLSLAGVQQIEFGDDYYLFINGVVRTFDDWKLTIPNIPLIDYLDTVEFGSGSLLLTIVSYLLNALIFAINGFSRTFNVVIGIANIVIQVVQFILTLIYECRGFINRLQPVVA